MKPALQPTLATAELEYPFDPCCIAAQPAEPRDAARLMVVHRQTGEVEHRQVRDLGDYLRAGDHLVLNRTAVLRARFKAQRVGGTRRTEGLFLGPRADGCWQVLLKQANRFHPRDRLQLIDAQGMPSTDHLCLVERSEDGWWLRFEGSADPDAVLERSGWTPVPPYIRRARGNDEAASTELEERDHRRYQTVYARSDARASVAAPTAGLHFTPELLDSLRARGVGQLELILDVGAGTFKPVEASTLADHRMHQERFHVPAATIAALRALEAPRAAANARLVVVGTTSARALESLPNPLPAVGTDYTAQTDLLISPGHRFRHLDALLTNFHLPRSTLLALVGAVVGLERLKELYALAQREGYRFYSYGDAMLLL